MKYKAIIKHKKNGLNIFINNELIAIVNNIEEVDNYIKHTLKIDFNFKTINKNNGDLVYI